MRFFTHLPGAGPAPGKPGGPGRAIRAGQRAARPRERAYGPPDMPGPTPGRTPAKQPPAAPAANSPLHRTNARRKGAAPMPEMQDGQEEQASNSRSAMAGPRIISYNLNEDERPGGMKVRFKVRVETGRKAAALDTRQARRSGSYCNGYDSTNDNKPAASAQATGTDSPAGRSRGARGPHLHLAPAAPAASLNRQIRSGPSGNPRPHIAGHHRDIETGRPRPGGAQPGRRLAAVRRRGHTPRRRHGRPARRRHARSRGSPPSSAKTSSGPAATPSTR